MVVLLLLTFCLLLLSLWESAIVQLPSLKVRRMRTIALESLKILNNLSPAYLNDLLTVENHSYNLGTRKQLKFHR